MGERKGGDYQKEVLQKDRREVTVLCRHRMNTVTDRCLGGLTVALLLEDGR